MDFSNWPFKNLLSVKDELEEAILGGDNSHKATLKAVNAEIELRKFILIGTLAGKKVAEYDRFPTAAAATDYAAAKGIPVNQDFLWGDKIFKTLVIEI